MIDWKRVPWSLWLFCASLLAGWVLVELDTHGTVAAKVLFAALMLAWIYYLLKAVWWLWVFTVAISVLGAVLYAITGHLDLFGVIRSLAALVLLLLPATRRYFAEDPPAAEAGTR
jgi:hypothetical protein